MKTNTMLVIIIMHVILKEAVAQNLMSNLPVLRLEKKSQLDGLYPVDGSLIGDVVSGTLIECGVQCGMTSGCVSLFYHADTSTCYLYRNEYTTSSNMTSIPGMTYMGQTGTGCESGWISFGSSCFYIDTTTERTFDDAKQYCQSLSTSSYLARIESLEEDQFLKNTLLAMAEPLQKVWIGLTDRETSQMWIWEDIQSVPPYTGWDYGIHSVQPSNNDEHCAIMYQPARYYWHDAACANTNYVLCKI